MLVHKEWSTILEKEGGRVEGEKEWESESEKRKGWEEGRGDYLLGDEEGAG